MPLARLLPAALLAMPLAASCLGEQVYTLVDCQSVWVCGDQETAEDDSGDEDLCLDASDPDRQEVIDDHVAELQSDCNAIPVNCIGGASAVCASSCTTTTVPCGDDAGS